MSDELKRSRLARPGWIWLPACLLLGYAAYWGYRYTVARLGALAPLALGLAGVILLLIILGWAWHRYHDRFIAVAARGAAWTWTRLRRTSPLRHLHDRHPTTWRFFTDRVNPRAATGLALSIAVIVAAAALWGFLEILFEVVSGSSVTAVDHRVIYLLAALREPGLDRFMLAFTYIGSGRSVAVLAVAFAGAAFLLGRRRDALLVLLSQVIGSAFFAVVKLIVQRPRPPLYDARLVQEGFSFPSGHATMSIALWGTVALLAALEIRRTWARVAIAATAVLLAFLIGLSRVYLGVHWPSDVLAGWVGGCVWVALAFALTRIWRARTGGPTSRMGKVLSHLAALVVAIAAIAFIVASRPPLPATPRAVEPPPSFIPPNAVQPTLLARMPHYTESLFGHRQEPVNLVFVATRPALEEVFRVAGWTQAVPLSWESLKRAAAATITGRSDPEGPVTPSFLSEQPEALAFSLPVGPSFAKRHHIRIWRSAYETMAGRVWLATASYDSGFAIAAGTLLPVHRIAPDIDTERDFIVRDLTRAGGVSVDTVQLVPPDLGSNAFGSSFFTDGRAVLLQLPEDRSRLPRGGTITPSRVRVH